MKFKRNLVNFNLGRNYDFSVKPPPNYQQLARDFYLLRHWDVGIWHNFTPGYVWLYRAPHFSSTLNENRECPIVSVFVVAKSGKFTVIRHDHGWGHHLEARPYIVKNCKQFFTMYVGVLKKYICLGNCQFPIPKSCLTVTESSHTCILVWNKLQLN